MTQTLTTNTITVSVSGVITYSAMLTASPTTFDSSGGSETLTVSVTTTPSGGNVSNLSVNFMEISVGSIGTVNTDSSGVATITFTVPSNSTTNAETYSFDASVTIP